MQDQVDEVQEKMRHQRHTHNLWDLLWRSRYILLHVNNTVVYLDKELGQTIVCYYYVKHGHESTLSHKTSNSDPALLQK